MKKVLVLLLMVVGFSANAQIRHVRHIKSLDAFYGTTAYGSSYSLGYVSYLSNTAYIKGAGFFESGKGNGITYSSYGVQAYYAKNIVHAGFHYYLNGIAGAHLSVDNTSASGEFKIPSSFKSGVLVGIENELFINDHIVFVVNVSQRMLLGSNFGNYRWFAEGGIRYNF